MEFKRSDHSVNFPLLNILTILKIFFLMHSTACNSFQELGNVLLRSDCTLLMSSDERDHVYSEHGLENDIFPAVCVLCASIKAAPGRMRIIMQRTSFRRLFTRTKYSLHCTVLLIRPESWVYPETTSDEEEKNSLINLAPFSDHWTSGINYDISYQTIISPDVLVFFACLRRNINNQTVLYVTLPVFMQMHPSKVLAFVTSIPVRATERWSNFGVLIGCSSCDKGGPLNTDVEENRKKHGYYQIVMSIVLLRRLRCTQLRLLNPSLIISNKYGIMDFGDMGERKPVSDRECMTNLLIKLRSSLPKIHDCIVSSFAVAQNCSNAFLNGIIRFYFRYEGAHLLGKSQLIHGSINTYYFPIAVEFDGMQYSVILGRDEKLSRETLLTILSSVASNEVWILLSVSLLSITMIVFGISSDWYWPLEILLENGSLGDRFFNHLDTAKFIGMVWMFATVVIRNMMSSSTTSAMSEPEAPRNIPSTLENVFMNQNNHTLIITTLTTGLRLFQMVEEKNKSWKGITLKQLQSIRFVDDTVMPDVFGLQISGGKHIKCSELKVTSMRKSYVNAACNTSRRLAVLYNLIGLDTTHTLEHIQPFFQFFQDRRLVKSKTTEVASFPWLWRSYRKFYFLEDFQRRLTIWNDLGILQKLANNKKIMRQWIALRRINKIRQSQFRGSLFRYSEESVNKRTKSEDVLTAVAMNVNELVNIAGIFFILLGFAFISLQLECLFSIVAL